MDKQSLLITPADNGGYIVSVLDDIDEDPKQIHVFTEVETLTEYIAEALSKQPPTV